LQIIEPFGDPVSKYIDTGLQPGEMITDLTISPSSSYIGLSTNGGRINLFERSGFGKTVHVAVIHPTSGEEVVRRIATPHTDTYMPPPPDFMIDSSLLSERGPKQLNPFNLYVVQAERSAREDERAVRTLAGVPP